jgi:hypothetical protein
MWRQNTLLKVLSSNIMLSHNFIKLIVFFFKNNIGKMEVLVEYLNILAVENKQINKWSIAGQIYIDFYKLYQKSATLFHFKDEEKV